MDQKNDQKGARLINKMPVINMKISQSVYEKNNVIYYYVSLQYIRR